MATRKTATALDPTKICMLALKQVKSAGDYHQINTANDAETFTTAWNTLTASDQQRITGIVNNDTQPEPRAIADELAASGSKIQLESLKSSYGDVAVRSAWRLLPQQERDRIKQMCGEKEEQKLMVEQPSIYKVTQPAKKQSLVELTSELQDLDDLLDTLDGDIPADVQLAVDELLNQRDDTQDAIATKLDSYCGLIQSRLMWAVARKAEADRLAKLAESDTKVVDFLRGRLKSHLQSTDQTKLRTKRFNISICGNGGKQPLRVDDVNPSELPEKFQRINVDINREAVRKALEQGEELSFAAFSERGTNLRIK